MKQLRGRSGNGLRSTRQTGVRAGLKLTTCPMKPSPISSGMPLSKLRASGGLNGRYDLFGERSYKFDHLIDQIQRSAEHLEGCDEMHRYSFEMERLYGELCMRFFHISPFIDRRSAQNLS